MRQGVDSIFLYESLILIWVFFLIFFHFSLDWFAMGLTILIIFILPKFSLKNSHRIVLPPLTCLFIVYSVFRIDQMVMKTPIVVFLTKLTSYSLIFFVKYSNSIPLIILVGNFCLFQSLGKKDLKNVPMYFSIFTFFLVLIAGAMLTGISHYEVSSIDVTTLQFKGLGRMARIAIIDSCSGIYGLLIFASSFFVFVNVTRANRTFKSSHMILSGLVGVIGIYLINLFRILFLIYLSLYFPTVLWNELHVYLGAVCVLCYLSFFWIIIWSILPVRIPS